MQNDGGRNPLTVDFEGRRYRYFRGGAAPIYISVRPSELNVHDVMAINQMCDTEELSRNVAVKKIIGRALSEHFNGASFHVNEIGCGKHPITTHLQPRVFSYHGIEVDAVHIKALKSQGLSISSWTDLPEGLVPEGRPAVAVAVYSMHFMLSKKFPEQIKSLISESGFFVGNLYTPPGNADLATQGRYLSGLLKQANMAHIKMQCPSDHAQSYWIIGKSQDVSGLHDFANALSRNIHRCQRLPPRIVR